jgi:hypothetical protein
LPTRARPGPSGNHAEDRARVNPGDDRTDTVEQHERFLRQQPRLLGEDEREQIGRLAADLPALWESASTTDADRKEVLRQIVAEVAVAVEGRTEWVEVRARWAGGRQTAARLRRPVARLEQLGDAVKLRERVRRLKVEGRTASQMADSLEREGYRTTCGRPFTAEGVRRLLSRYGLSRPRRDAACELGSLGPGEWLIPDLARQLGIPPATVYSWARRGVVSSRRVGDEKCARVVVTGLHDLERLTDKPVTVIERRRDGDTANDAQQ